MTDGNPVLLQLENITKCYDAPVGNEKPVILRDVSLSVGRGETLAIIGPSGCGKSTLLNIIGALDTPTSGTVRLEGRDLREANEQELARIRNQQIGFIFQLHHLLPQCTVLENVLLPTLALGKKSDPNPARERAERLLKRVGLDSRLAYRPGLLSGGERQRVAVVRALINQPILLLADEPTGALDQESSAELVRLLVELNQEEAVALIVVTHSIDVAKQMGRILQLRNGRLEPVRISS